MRCFVVCMLGCLFGSAFSGEIHADQALLDPQSKTLFYRHHVHVQQANTEILGESLEALLDENGKISTITVFGKPAYYSTQREKSIQASAEKITLVPKTSTTRFSRETEQRSVLLLKLLLKEKSRDAFAR